MAFIPENMRGLNGGIMRKGLGGIYGGIIYCLMGVRDFNGTHEDLPSKS
jgi:hypothetical protein